MAIETGFRKASARMSATVGVARNGLRRIDGRLRPGALVLAYHRVGSPAVDPWGQSVDPERFARQMALVASACRPVTLRELGAAVPGREIARAVAVTFDDGYRDNLHVAAPVLRRFGIPATLFAVSGAIGTRRPFWWDRLEALLIAPAPDVCVRVGGVTRRWELGPVPPGGVDGWRAGTAPTSPRHRAFMELWLLLRGRPAAERDALAAAVADALGDVPDTGGDARALPMDEAELAAFAAQPGMEVGSHTVTHAVIPRCTAEVARRELVESRRRLADVVGHPVEGFAFPHGVHSRRARRLVADAGYRHACTLGGVPVRERTRCAAIPRFIVGDWDDEEFERRLMGRLR